MSEQSRIEKEGVSFGILRRFARDQRGVGAIEFAILFPVLLMLYLGAFELTVGLNVSKRASRAAGSVADILSQRSSVVKSDLATMPSVASAIFAPYATTGLTLKITGIAVDASGNATVAWSWAQDGTRPYSPGTALTVPNNMNQASTFLIRSELALPYQLLSFGTNFLPSGTNQITISRQYYYRQRVGSSISCSDC
ncbi:hypothetical protein A6U86_20625 [Rhizobium sp. AC27/96]|uniref:TadE/TadG family type IV pilus assembly protein n=1 Tax=Rhizobium sp. AC27/96 TaxID=1841653 RepID=UPI0008276712|nr:TadE/TadG family type IV pilus assembly protein [Rhizobium sp. AC27/96]OCI91920.1 hypothetical protein A6U86_20625 [Rhizobium sp. AC27/96]